MFLNLLDHKEKKSFLKLAHHVANSDNDFSDEQKQIINQYCIEMQIDDISLDEKNEAFISVLEEIKNPKSQRIILLEIMALIYSDNYLHQEEQLLLDEMLKAFKLSNSLSEVYANWSKSVLALYAQANALIEL